MPISPKTIVISASDAFYAPLVNDLYQSIRTLKFAHPFDLGLLDVGLAEKRPYFEPMGLTIATAEVDIDYPSRAHWEGQRPGIRTLTATPFLRRYFPGYDLYIWLDADMWVQTPEAIDTIMVEAGQSPAIFIAPEFDRCYTPFFQNAEIWHKYVGWYEASFPQHVVSTMMLKPMMNVGLFAMTKDSPIWDIWAAIYREALQKTSDLNDKAFMAHQLAMNIAIYMKHVPCVTLPASFNWLTTFALPVLDRATGLYVEPLPPYRPISHIHLTRDDKIGIENIQCRDGTSLERRLTFSGRKS